MYGVTLILVLAVVGGVIAVIGDRLGTRIGKKKLTLFGLRPRHTAVVVTIFTGVCITTVTFGILAAASENVRTALFGMDRLNAMIADTRAALDATASALTSAEEAKQAEETARRERERKLQEATLAIKKKFGKNALLKGRSLLDGATGKDRNEQIGGHRA